MPVKRFYYSLTTPVKEWIASGAWVEKESAVQRDCAERVANAIDISNSWVYHQLDLHLVRKEVLW